MKEERSNKGNKEVSKEGSGQERKYRRKGWREKEGRGRVGKDVLHHVRPFLANYLPGLRRNTKTRELSNAEQSYSVFSKETFGKEKGSFTSTQ